MKTLISTLLVIFLLPFNSIGQIQKIFPVKTGTQWYPYLEWSVENPTFEGNPYDVEASVAFTHTSGAIHTTPMFYAEDEVWKFRFTGTKTGEWTFSCQSDDPELNGLTGKVNIEPNPDPNAHGFITRFDNKWGWQGTDRAFVPQLVMYDNPSDYYEQPEKIDQDIDLFFDEHGFNGFHSNVLMRWFDLNEERYTAIESEDPNPDPRTFEALELLIGKVHAAGGMVHLWAWGDEARKMTPIKWGKNGKVDRRLQRYIAARLGPLPGWSMGYGFDLDEWVDENDLEQWHSYMHEQFGWHHFLGGRSRGPNHGTDHEGYQIYTGLDYAGYEHHRPTYEVYVAALEKNPNKPVFSEDRFRIRQPSRYPEKDYNEELTRRGLWASAMAGGVANIWGNLVEAPSDASVAYENKHWIKTYATFFEKRFLKGMFRDNELTDGVCLRTLYYQNYLFYKEDADEIVIDLSQAKSFLPVIAVDTLKSYKEINLGMFSPKKHIWKATGKSDWAIAVGDFGGGVTSGIQ